MNRIFDFISAAAAALALSLFGWTHWGTVAADALAVAAPAAAPVPFASLKIDATRTIDLDLDDAGFDELTVRERRDQLLDWLLLAVLSDAGLSADQLNQTTFDLPARRYGALKPTAQFEYGPIRSRALADGRVAVLVPAGSNGAARKDHLAHAFDEQRKNLGEPPKSLLVFEYGLDGKAPSARLTRRADVPGSALLGSDYGYLERVVASADELTQFMTAVDDLTFVKQEEQALRVGGRKFQAYRARTIRTQDVAALWQSEVAIGQKRRAYEQRWKGEFDALNARMRAWRGTSSERAAAEARFKAEGDALDERAARDRTALGALDHSGFSLDPAIDFEELKPTFEGFASRLMRLGGPAVTEVHAARSALGAKDIAPLLRLLDRMQRDRDPALAELAEMMDVTIHVHHSYQAARYDGELAGTEVGMNLFYTDLLAKLWALNFRTSAPKGPIPDFWPLTEVNVSPVYRQEVKELSNTRLWFGHQDQGFQVADRGRQLLFARNATRVYAASSRSLEPGKESEPNAESERFLGWWNDHFEEVARFEPEYERLNQIMKWSVVIGWLNAADQGQRLGFLESVAVDRMQWFPEWVSRHPELRFQAWRDVGFHKRGHLGAKTETMPILRTTFKKEGRDGWLAGGVSLAPRKMFEARAALDANVQPWLRRAGLDYSSSSAGGLRTLGKANYNLSGGLERAVLTATPREGARLRLPSGEFKASRSERTVAYRSSGVSLDTNVGGKPLGRLDIERSANGFTVGWRGRDLDAGQALARRLANEPNAASTLRNDPAVQALLMMDDQQVGVLMRGQEQWVKMAPQSKPSVRMPEGWDMRVADAQSRRIMQLQWLEDPSALLHQLPDDAVVAIQRGRPQGPLEMRVERPPHVGSAAGETLTFQRDGLELTAVRSADGSTRVRLGDLRKHSPDDPLALAQSIGAASRSAPGATSADLPWGASADAAPLLRALRKQRLSDAAHRIAKDPAAAGRVLDEGLRQGIAHVDDLGRQGMALKALTRLEELITVHGPLPDLQLRKALALIQRGRNASAAEAVAGSHAKTLRDPVSLLAEVESRMFQSAQANTAGEFSRLHDLARWRERTGGGVAGSERLAVSGAQDRLSLDLHAKQVKLEPLAPDDAARARSGEALIYVQDTPALSNLDFSVSVPQALAGLPAGRLPRVLQTGNQTIADFRPDKIFLGDPQVTYQLAHKPGTQALQGARSGSSDRCSRYPEAPECRQEAAARDATRAPPRIVIVELSS